ncbi:formate dehydrogenase accessory sulfurtransferase FdhD [Bacillaceae bacterium]
MWEVPVTVKQTVYKYRGENFFSEDDEIASEYPLTIFINGEEFATVVCTPSALDELVVGFLASEGAIRTYEEIAQLLIDPRQGFAYVDLKRPFRLDPRFYTKRRITSCCGKSRQSFYFLSDARTAKKITLQKKIPAEACFRLMHELQASSSLHRETGGVHNVALCTEETLLVTYADIGRHNAIDKLYGYCLKNGIETADKILAFSGRISSEVLLKAAKIGTGILLSKSAPTDLALQLADELGITAVGFIRGEKMNIYTHPERIEIKNNKIKQ